MTPQTSLNAYIKQALVENARRLAFTDLHGESFSFENVAEQAAKFHIAFKDMGIAPGDKIALCGKNSSRWAIAFVAVISYGAVAVPILHEFKPDSVHHLVDHSDSKALFVDDAIWKQLDPDKMKKLKAAVNIADFKLLYAATQADKEAYLGSGDKFGKEFGGMFTPDKLDVRIGSMDDEAVINYTSGSTGFSKGVVLTNRSLWSNIQYCIDGLTFLLPGDGTVCMLPLAHMFGLMVEMLHPFVKGCHINFITKAPSPRVILDAFGTVKPKLIITVPLVLEKIIQSKVLPQLKKPAMRAMLTIPGLCSIILAKIRKKIIDAFGGQVQEIIIGGAGLNKEVESFLRRIKFPYTVGYGMTECGPLICYCPWRRQKAMSCGVAVPRMELRVDSDDPANIPGVLWVRGDNVMKEYYKNPEATNAVMGDDGWMNTGDICIIDSDGYVYIKGRDKTMILGPSGQNIYPEEIEQVINNMPLVAESLVISEGTKLIALIFPNLDEAKKQGLDAEGIENLMRENIKAVNKQVSSYSRIADLRIMEQEFEKTPKRSIKRFLYQK